MIKQTDRMVQDAALEARGVMLTGRRDGTVVPITDPFDITVMPGEAVAIVGESGSGKSLAVRSMLGLLPPGVGAQGTVLARGRDLTGLPDSERRAMRGRELAYVMQDPFTMLNPLHRCGHQVTEALRDGDGRRLDRRARRQEAVRRLAEVGITDPTVADRYPFELSGGMRQRVAIAAAIAEDPAVLIADEPTTALDVTTQRDILALLDRLRTTHEMALVLITHDLRVATSVCDRVYVMYAGTVVETGPTDSFVAAPRHPYSAALLAADPPLDRRLARLASIPGQVPAPGSRPEGCRFAPRCSLATDACVTALPALVEVAEGHQVRCIRSSEKVPAPTSDLTFEQPQELGDRRDRAPVIEVRDVVRTFGRATVVRGVDLDVHRGECVGLVGESGSGKTTLARMMVGLTEPSAGTVRVGGVDLAQRPLSKPQWVEVRNTVQMAFQDPHSTLNPHRTVGATLAEAAELAGADDVGGRVADLLERVGLNAATRRRMPAQLSGGERQRVAIARALARDPAIVVCDEVVSALDVSVQAHILNLLADLRVELGLGYVFISHDLAVVRQVADRIYVLKDGEVMEHGETASVLSDPRHAYTRQLINSIPRKR